MTSTPATPQTIAQLLAAARAARQAGETAGALQALRTVLALDPSHPEALLDLAGLQADSRQLPEAMETLSRARALAGETAAIASLSARLQYQAGEWAGAEAEVRRALRLGGQEPSEEDYKLLVRVLMDQLRTGEALDAWEKQLRDFPGNATSRSAFLFTCDYREDDPHREIDRLREWDRRHGKPLDNLAFNNDRSFPRRLRIGYFSPDFRWHAIGVFSLGVLQAHDPASVELFCYSNGPAGDLRTREFAKRTDHWVNISKDSDESAAEMIRKDGIDILVDLAGHGGGGRMGLFALKPAPIQAAWMGFCNSTGLSAVDYRFSEALAEPPGLADEISAETIIRLPVGAHAYTPPPENPPLRPAPSTLGAPTTFGCFNNAAKVTPEVVQLWSQILRERPSSRLLLKAAQFASPLARASTLRRFEAQGVSSKRIRLIEPTPSSAQHWDSFGLVDVCLDPFPYNGTTTTCDAVWMGVPVVALEGRVHRARMGLSLLTQMGRSCWVAATAEGYVRLALALADRVAQGATDLDRALIRRQFLESPLCDPTALARRLESAYRDVWLRWLRASGPHSL
jgi:protein O-GlcNAc transferase